MRKYFFILFISAIAIQTNAQKFTDAVSYNDFIISEQAKIGDEILEFNDMMSQASSTKEILELKLDTMVLVAKSALASVEHAGPFEDNTRFYNSIVALFGYYTEIMGTTYYTLLNLFFVPEYTTEVATEIESIINEIVQQEALYDNEFAEAQMEFAARYNFTLEANELQEKIDQE